MRLFPIWLACCIMVALPAPAAEQSTPARAAMIVDVQSGAILLEKEADLPLPPASMSKLMTLYMVFDALKSGQLSLEDSFRTSKRASEMGGSKMFIREGEVVSIENLLRGVIIQSGNDAAVALAEALAGTEEAFAARMTKRAQDLGMTQSTFANATGWPHPDQVMSIRDIASLSERLITEFPEHYTYFAETEFTWDGITQKNRNPLLGLGIGSDGLKTGHTEEAGYGLAASAKRGDRRVIVVVTGLESAAQRRQESERLVNWAFRAFEARSIFKAGEPLATASVWIGSSSTIPLVPEKDVTVLVPTGRFDEAELSIRYNGPIPAPISAGEALGMIEVRAPDMAPVKVPLIASHAVAEGGFLARLQAAAELALLRLLPEDG